jgi:hypothetical protein
LEGRQGQPDKANSGLQPFTTRPAAICLAFISALIIISSDFLNASQPHAVLVFHHELHNRLHRFWQ